MVSLISRMRSIFRPSQPDSIFAGRKDRPKNIRAVAPRGRPLYRFRALYTFESPDTESVYFKNAIYTVREGNKKLDNLVQSWLNEKPPRVQIWR